MNKTEYSATVAKKKTGFFLLDIYVFVGVAASIDVDFDVASCWPRVSRSTFCHSSLGCHSTPAVERHRNIVDFWGLLSLLLVRLEGYLGTRGPAGRTHARTETITIIDSLILPVIGNES